MTNIDAETEILKNIIQMYQNSFQGKIFFCTLTKLLKYNDVIVKIQNIPNAIKLFETLERNENLKPNIIVLKRISQHRYTFDTYIQYTFEKKYIWNSVWDFLLSD